MEMYVKSKYELVSYDVTLMLSINKNASNQFTDAKIRVKSDTVTAWKACKSYAYIELCRKLILIKRFPEVYEAFQIDDGGVTIILKKLCVNWVVLKTPHTKKTQKDLDKIHANIP